MRASLKIPAWIFLIFTAVTATFGAWVFFTLKKGGYDTQAAGLTFLFVLTWLGIFGLITTILGALGVWRSRKLNEHISMVYKLSLGIGLLALIGGGMFGVYG